MSFDFYVAGHLIFSMIRLLDEWDRIHLLCVNDVCESAVQEKLVAPTHTCHACINFIRSAKNTKQSLIPSINY